MASTYVPIATTTLGSPSTSISISSIPATYTDLVLTVVTQTTTSSSDLLIQFNSDTGANYATNAIDNSPPSSTSTFADYTSTSGILAGLVSTLALSFTRVDIFSYASSNYKTTLSESSRDTTDTSNSYVRRTSGMWASTSAITSVQITANGLSFDSGTTATLYGIKAA